MIYTGHVECNLCGMQFEENDKDIFARMRAHSIFHSNARIQKRNTTQGTPVFNRVYK